jgi:NTP pyrophosphatase (non-canonical NTP hydrolase)
MRELVRTFVRKREWEQFHAPKNLAMSIAIEAAELMEHFQWLEVAASRQLKSDPQKMTAIGEELADVLSYCIALANSLDLDISHILRDKMAKNALKYPAQEFRGRSGRE